MKPTSGVDAALGMRRDFEHLPWIVGLSGDSEIEERFAAFGMDDFVAKPLLKHNLIDVLNRAMDGLPS